MSSKIENVPKKVKQKHHSYGAFVYLKNLNKKYVTWFWFADFTKCS